MRNTAKKSFLYLSVLIVTSTVIAAPTPQDPIFNSFWYTDAKYYNPSPACAGSAIAKIGGYYNYTNKGTSKENVAQQAFSQLPNQSCTWDPNPTFKQYIDNTVAPDFPANADEYKKIQTLSKNEWMATFQCKNYRNETMLIQNIIIYPSYSCPVGTVSFQIETSNIENFVPLGCYPFLYPACTSDVSGRDLDSSYSPDVINQYGHIGIVGIPACSSDKKECSPGLSLDNSPITSEIFEVLNENSSRHSVVFLDSLTSFAGRSSNYWGIKYDLPNHQISGMESMQIYSEAINLYNAPSDYTFFWYFRVAGTQIFYTFNNGKAIKEVGDLPGLYRCDSFVEHCFQKVSLKIPYSGLMTPLSLFNAFVSQRNELSDSINTQIPFLTKLFTTPDDLENQITAVFQADSFDSIAADDLTKQYIEDNNISREKKINYFWSLSQNYKKDNNKFNYLMNCLGYIRCYELADDLIQLYRVEFSEDVRHSLILAMSQSTIFYTQDQVEALSQQDINNITIIQNFLQEISETESNSHLAGTALLHVIPILPFDKADKLLTRVYFKNNKVLDVHTFYLEKIALILKENVTLQTKKLAELIHAYQNDSAFTEALYYATEHLNIKKLAPAMYKDSILYLKEHEKALNDSKDPWIFRYKQIIRDRNFIE